MPVACPLHTLSATTVCVVPLGPPSVIPAEVFWVQTLPVTTRSVVPEASMPVAPQPLTELASTTTPLLAPTTMPRPRQPATALPARETCWACCTTTPSAPMADTSLPLTVMLLTGALSEAMPMPSPPVVLVLPATRLSDTVTPVAPSTTMPAGPWPAGMVTSLPMTVVALLALPLPVTRMPADPEPLMRFPMTEVWGPLTAMRVGGRAGQHVAGDDHPGPRGDDGRVGGARDLAVDDAHPGGGGEDLDAAAVEVEGLEGDVGAGRAEQRGRRARGAAQHRAGPGAHQQHARGHGEGAHHVGARRHVDPPDGGQAGVVQRRLEGRGVVGDAVALGALGHHRDQRQRARDADRWRRDGGGRGGGRHGAEARSNSVWGLAATLQGARMPPSAHRSNGGPPGALRWSAAAGASSCRAFMARK